MNDLRIAVRKLLNAPGFTIAAVLTLALGIGANTAIFSVVYGVLVKPLPFSEPDRIVRVWQTDLHNNEQRVSVSMPDFEDFVAQNGVFADMAAFTNRPLSVTDGRSEPDRVTSALVPHNLFSLLGSRPALGRPFMPGDDKVGAAAVAILSHSLWQRRYAGNPAVVGEQVMLDGAPHTIVGVMPAAFQFPAQMDLWIALEPNNQTFRGIRGVHNLGVIGRLKNGISVEEAQREMTVIATRLEQQYPDDNVGRGVLVESLQEAMTGRARRVLVILLGAVTMVLLIACTNVAGLMLVRAAARSREIAVRMALGARRGRLVRQLLTESLVLSLLGAAAGIAVAHGGVRLFLLLAPEGLPRRSEIVINFPVLLFLLIAATLCGVVLGLLPAYHSLRERLATTVRTTGAAAGSSQLRRSIRSVLVIGEVAIALILTVGAGLLLRSFWSLLQVDPGFAHRNAMKIELSLSKAKYPEPSRDKYPDWPEAVQFYDQLLERLERIPGMTSVSLAMAHPLDRSWTTRVYVAGRARKEGPQDESRFRPVAPAYFKTVGVRILQGRDVDDRDRLNAPLVALVNEAFARKYFPGENPVGRGIEFWGTQREVIGVVGDVRFMGPQTPAEPAIYPSIHQTPMGAFAIVYRAEPSVWSVLPAVRDTVWSIDRDLALIGVDTLDNLLEESVGPQQLNVTLLVLFGGLALLLAAIGIYGVISYQATLRQQEFGIRLAIGAEGRQLAQLVLRQAATLAAAGLAVGLAGALLLTRLMRTMLFDVSPFDPQAFAAAAALLAIVALAASWLPAHRASKVDPMIILRSE